MGKCKACRRRFKLDRRELCSNCAFKIDSADKRAESIEGIRKDMEELGIPVRRLLYAEEED